MMSISELPKKTCDPDGPGAKFAERELGLPYKNFALQCIAEPMTAGVTGYKHSDY